MCTFSWYISINLYASTETASHFISCKAKTQAFFVLGGRLGPCWQTRRASLHQVRSWGGGGNLLIISQIFTNFQLCLPPFSEGRKWRFFLNSPHTHHSFLTHKWTALRYVLVLCVRKKQQLQYNWQKMGTPVLYWYKYIEIRSLRLGPLITVRKYSDTKPKWYIVRYNTIYILLIPFAVAIFVGDSAQRWDTQLNPWCELSGSSGHHRWPSPLKSLTCIATREGACRFLKHLVLSVFSYWAEPHRSPDNIAVIPCPYTLSSQLTK